MGKINNKKGHDAEPLQSERILSTSIQKHPRAVQHPRRRIREVVDSRRRRATRLLIRQVTGEVLRVLGPSLHNQDDHERRRRGTSQHTHRLS